MAHNLGMDGIALRPKGLATRRAPAQLIAEGVEIPEQIPKLQTLGCEYAQGYYFARPLFPNITISLVAKMSVFLD